MFPYIKSTRIATLHLHLGLRRLTHGVCLARAPKAPSRRWENRQWVEAPSLPHSSAPAFSYSSCWVPGTTFLPWAPRPGGSGGLVWPAQKCLTIPSSGISSPYPHFCNQPLSSVFLSSPSGMSCLWPDGGSDQPSEALATGSPTMSEEMADMS